MTSSVIRKYALAALCGAAIIGVGQSAQAATWTILGGGAPSSPANYGPANGQNNVINNPAAGVVDTINVPINASIVSGANLQANFVSSYTVSWVYLGSESDNNIRFFGPGVVATGFLETDLNNNCAACATNPSPQTGTVPMGTAVLQTAVLPAFRFLDLSDGTGAANGANFPDNVNKPNFLMSYAVDIGGGVLALTTSVSDIVVIGFNDTGAPDDNHDDFMLAAFISELPGETNTPIPGALPLFASVLGGGFLFRRLRNRRLAKAAA